MTRACPDTAAPLAGLLWPALATAVAAATPAVAADAKPSLRDVPEIEDPLFAIAIADEVRDQCPEISGRVMKGLAMLYQLRSRANELGYSDAEIRAYVESKTEKARMRAKGEAFVTARGVDLDDPQTFCAFGRAEIAKNSAIGALLKAN